MIGKPKRNGEQASSIDEGYDEALDVLRACCISDGFLASCTEKGNYRRIWGRDGVIIGLGALLTADQLRIDAFKNTFHPRVPRVHTL
jgi:hypothetical protein